MTARRRFAEMLDHTRREPVTVERRGSSAAVILSPEEYGRMLEAAEELEDIEAFDQAMAEEGDDVPWDQVKRDLGWT